MTASLLGAVALLLGASPASAATFPVTSDDDAGANTLRSAITAANANGSAVVDQIPISVTGSIDLVSELPPVTTPTTITGPGLADLRIRRVSGTFRTLSVSTSSPTEAVRIEGLTLADGIISTSGGGGLIVSGPGQATLQGVAVNGNSAPVGGGIYNNGSTLNLIDSIVNDNTTLLGGTGGGIHNEGTLSIVSSALTFNDSQGSGGAISTGVSPTASLGIVNSTIAVNTAYGVGGAIVQSLGTVAIVSSTIADNASNFDNAGGEQGGGTASFASANFSVVNTIYAHNVAGTGPGATPSQCTGQAHESLGYNLKTSDEPGCLGFTTVGDVYAPNPLLGVLGNYGGPTRTIPLLAGSPAIDAASPVPFDVLNPTVCRVVDQRGMPRGGAAGRCDIGAYEEQPPAQADGDLKKPVKKCKRKRKKGKRASAAKKKRKKCGKRKRKRA